MSYAGQMDEQEIKLWKKCDVKVMNRLTAIQLASYRGDFDGAMRFYEELEKRYERIDASELDGRFPVSVIIDVRKKLKDLKEVLESRDRAKVSKAIGEIASLARGFATERYDAYRSIVKEEERDG